jgi:hypothetical protein
LVRYGYLSSRNDAGQQIYQRAKQEDFVIKKNLKTIWICPTNAKNKQGNYKTSHNVSKSKVMKIIDVVFGPITETHG